MKIEEHLHDLAQMVHPFDELREAIHVSQPSLRTMTVLDISDLVSDVVYRTPCELFRLISVKAVFELGNSLVECEVSMCTCLSRTSRWRCLR